MASMIPQMDAEKEGLISEAVTNAQETNDRIAKELRKEIEILRKTYSGISSNRWDIRKKMDVENELIKKQSRLSDLETSRGLLRSKYERIQEKYAKALGNKNSKLISSSFHSAKSFRKSNVVLMSPENTEECMRQHLRADLGLQDVPLMLSAGDVCETCGIQMSVVNNDSMLTCSQCHKLRLLPNSMTTTALHGTDIESSTAITKHRLPEWIEMAQGKEFSEPPDDVVEAVAKFMIENGMSGLEEFRKEITEERERGGMFLGAQDAIKRLKIPDLERRLKSINSNTVRTALRGIVVNGKSEKFRKFYERSSKIAALVGGYWPPRMNGQQEEQLRLLYTIAAPEYEKRRKPKQTYWPGGFPFFLRCLCILLGWDEFATQFPTSSTKEGGARDLLRNEIWSELGWELVPYAGSLPPISYPDGISRSINLEDDDEGGGGGGGEKTIRKEVETKIGIKKRQRVDFELECS